MKSCSRGRSGLTSLLRQALAAAGALLYPPHCAVCLASTQGGQHLCRPCRHTLPRLRGPRCRQCSEPFRGQISREFVCARCREQPFSFMAAVAAFRAAGPVRELVHQFKYRKQYFLRHELARWLAQGLRDPRLAAVPAPALVPVPLHPVRCREREFNQAEVLAELVARRHGLPLLPALRRTRYTTTQTKLTRTERMENLRGAFAVPQSAPVRGRHLFLIDDVFTTGSTVEECARMLCRAGAASVHVLTVARAARL